MLVHEFLERSAAHLPQQEALVCGDERLSYAEVDSLANGVAEELCELGVGPGDRVVIRMENSVAVVAAIFGVLKAGGVMVPLNPGIKPAKLEWIINDCAPRAVITADGITPTRDSPLATRSALAAILYTSGSTGTPRGVMLTHANIDAASSSIIEYLGNTADDVIINFLPLSFDYGLYNVLMPLRFGGRVVLEKSFLYPWQLVGLLKRERVTGLPIVPTIAAGLVKLRSIDGYELPDLRYITSTGQALPPAHIARLREIFPSARLFSMYGLTECKRVAYLPPEELDRRPASVGKAMPRTEAWVVDANGDRAKPGEVGELVVRGPHVMQGYWNLPDETASVLRDGVLHTGDLFRTDDDGFLYFVARKDDLIKTAGERVSPREIENVVHALEGVAEAAVFGVPDEVLGSAIKVKITLRDGATLSANDVRAHCEEHLERHMIPKHIEFGELPRSANGKRVRA